MDEEQNNEQNLMEKANENIQDTTNAIKDGANLAKNVSTGNVLGAVKDGIKLAKNKKVRIAILTAILIPIIVIITLAMSLFSIFDTIGDTIQSVINSFINLFTADDSWDGSITIKDEDIQKVIDSIQEMGFDMDDLWLLGDIEREDTDTEETLKTKQEEAAKKYIRKFLEAQLVTETPYYNANANGNAYNQKTYGKVYIYRADEQEIIDENSKATLMSWMPYSKMKEEAEKNTQTALNKIKLHYSIDEEGKLVIAQWTTIESVGQINNKEVIINLKHIDYKSAISQYSTPMNFFVYLTMVSQNPEFVSSVTELVKNSRIELTIMDTKTVNVEVDTYGYTRNTKTTHQTEKQGEEIRTWTTTGHSNITLTTTTTTTTFVPTPKITYAKTWFSEQRVTYKLEDQDPYHNYEKYGASDDPSLTDDPEPGNPPANQSVSWNTNKYREITTDRTGTTYKEKIRSNVEYKGGEKGDQGVTPDSYKDKEKRKVKDKFNIDSKTTFVGLLDDFFRIPNSNRYEAAGKTNMVSGAEWLFGLMEKDGNLQNLEQVMRYIMYKYTGKEYGVKELDLSIFDIRDFVTISANTNNLEELLKSYENEQLRRYMNNETSLYSSVEKFVTQDKTKYKMYYTDFDGCLNFSYGIMVRNSSGKINNSDYFSSEGINLQQLLNDYDNGKEVLVDVKVIDNIFSKIVQDKKNLIKDIFEQKGVTLKQNQLDALVNVAYQYGNCGQYIQGSNNIIELYKNYYEKGDTNSFKEKAQAQTNSGRDYIFSDSSTRKIRNWILFNEGRYILSNGMELRNNSDVGDFALQFVGEGHTRFTDWYGIADEWCAMFVSYCYNECGLIPDVLKERFAACTSEAKTLISRGEFIYSSSGYIPSSGDIIFFTWSNTQYLSDHVGIVTSCDGQFVSTVEGNATKEPYYYQRKVTTKKWNINSACILRIFPSTIINKGELYEK